MAISGRPSPLEDGRLSDRARDIARGAARLALSLSWRCLPEVALANGRRADLVAIDASGTILIIEIKSSIADFRADAKWPDYRAFCDQLLFAVAPDFPREILPEETGLIVADRYGGELVRPAPEHRLAPARRKAFTLRLARLGAGRLMAVSDPEMSLESLTRE